MNIKESIVAIATEAQRQRDEILRVKRVAALQEQAKLQAERDLEEQRLDAETDVWVTDTLPTEVRISTLNGVRELLVNDRQARACTRASLTVKTEWIDETRDEGMTYGGFYKRWVAW